MHEIRNFARRKSGVAFRKGMSDGRYVFFFDQPTDKNPLRDHGLPSARASGMNGDTLLDGWTVRAWISSILAGTWVNTVFVTLEAFLFVFCLSHLKLPRWFKSILWFLFLCDLYATLALYAEVFIVFVIAGPSNFRTQSTPSVPQVQWPELSAAVCNTITTVVVHLILVYRYWMRPARTIWINLWSGFLLSIILVHTALIVDVMSTLVLYSTLVHGSSLGMTGVATVFGALTDSIIAVSLLHARIRTRGKTTTGLNLWTICLKIISSGVVPASMSILGVVLFYKSLSPTAAFFFSFTPRLYAITVFSNLIDWDPTLLRLDQEDMSDAGREPEIVLTIPQPMDDGASSGRISLTPGNGTPSVKEPAQHATPLLVEKPTTN